MNSLSSSPFSPHNDVLNATPTTTEEKIRLIEELKRRGRVCVTSKRFPDARELYTKAIDIQTTLVEINEDSNDNSYKKDLSILYSNRSLCNLQMNKASDSHADASSATCYDPAYLKGYWRLGQACMALKSTQEAVVAYETALELDSENKALKKEYERAKKVAEKEKLDEEKKEEEKKENKSAVTKKIEVMEGKKTMSSTTSSAEEEKKTEKQLIVEGDEEFSKSDHIRGYKIIGGKKTSFFHHEQTEEEKRLIGSIAPKRIDADVSTGGNDDNSSSATSGTSAWNKAGTWEERNLTTWAISTLTEKLLQCTYTLPSGSPDEGAIVKVTNVTKLDPPPKGTAHASVATVRGKKRYIYEFAVCVHWEVQLTSGVTCTGNMTFPDVDGTHEIGDGYDISDYSVGDDTPGDCRYLLERFVRDGGMKGILEKCLDDWVGLFRETY